MADDRTFVIIGGGQAGGWTAKTLRGEGFEGRVLMIADEPYIPYERPPLSKEVLLGDQPVESTYLWPADSYDESNIELRLGVQATRILPAGHTIEIDGGETIAYDRLMIATGARVRRLPITGAELSGIHYLRGIRDTEDIRADLSAESRVLVVGGGWIGLEVAAAAAKLGAEVTVVEALGQLCGRALTPDLAQWVLELHQSHGVDVRLETSVEHFDGDGHVAHATLSDGTSIDTDLVVIGIGVVPNVELAAEAGLEIDNGIVVDEMGRTSDPDIFAAGDVTNHPNGLLGRRVRLESWENAQNQGIAAAKAMLDTGAPYNEVPWFWSDQYDANIQLIGLPEGWTETVTRGDPKSGAFVVFYLKDGRIDGAAAINNPRDIRFARRLMAAGKVVDPTQLADPDVKLQALLKG
jgi:3-phenylpropionate/trans-cinnamate dioxygenase ferredoxin reductase subunit